MARPLSSFLPLLAAVVALPLPLSAAAPNRATPGPNRATPSGSVRPAASPSPSPKPVQPEAIGPFQEKAAKFNEILTVPTFEKTPAEIQKSAADGIAAANAALDKIGAQDPGKVTFDSTVGALDSAVYAVTNLTDRLALIQQTHPDKAVRDAAQEAVKTLQAWTVGADYREDVYKVVRAFADTHPTLDAEPARLLEFTLRDYRRAGLALPPDTRAEVEKLRRELAAAQTDFAANITACVVPVAFTRAELAGVPDDFLNAHKTGPDQYTVKANEAYQYNLVMDNAKSGETRHKLYLARDNMARDKNTALFNHLLELRNAIALKLGYKSWDDYQTEVKMAGTGAAAEKFIDNLIVGTEPKFDVEVAEMGIAKSADLPRPTPTPRPTGDPMSRDPRVPDPNKVVHVWDGRYYVNQFLKTRYQIDTEALRVYFPMQKVLDGMFRVYEHDFGLKFTPLVAPYKWVPDLQLFVASDAQSGEPLGLFYLDLFPREGKYNHFEELGVIDGKALDNGKYQRPVVCLVCNFPPPGADGKPSLLSHADVVTVFHEFGHALHGMLTRARFGRFAGTNVPGDFVEAPSQMLENWAWDKTVLDSFAADYRDPKKKIPALVLGRMKEAKLATAGVYYRRQLAFAKLDLVLHGPHPAGEPYDGVAASNAILNTVFLPIDPDTAFVAGFGHLADGYDAGYYGYAWAESIAADMATVFRQAKDGFMDAEAGMRLRKEIYEPGNSRDVAESIEKFLGRPRSIEPFLANNLGIQPAATNPAQKPGGNGPASPNVK